MLRVLNSTMEIWTFLFVIIIILVIWFLVTGDDVSQKRKRTKETRKKVRRSNRKCSHCGKVGHDIRTCSELERRRRSEAALTRKRNKANSQLKSINAALQGVGIKSKFVEGHSITKWLANNAIGSPSDYIPEYPFDLIVSDEVQEILALLDSNDPAVHRKGILMAKAANIPDISPVFEALNDVDSHDLTPFYIFFQKVISPLKEGRMVLSYSKESHELIRQITMDVEETDKIRLKLMKYDSKRGIVRVDHKLTKQARELKIVQILEILKGLERGDDKRLAIPLCNLIANYPISRTTEKNDVIPALCSVVKKHVKGQEKKNILKFLKSDDPGISRMGVSMLKGILAEE